MLGLVYGLTGLIGVNGFRWYGQVVGLIGGADSVLWCGLGAGLTGTGLTEGIRVLGLVTGLTGLNVPDVCLGYLVAGLTGLTEGTLFLGLVYGVTGLIWNEVH